jgi:hypothetical protein
MMARDKKDFSRSCHDERELKVFGLFFRNKHGEVLARPESDNPTGY